jgi:hypothetical protein
LSHMMSKQFPADIIAYRPRTLQQLFQLFMLSIVILLIGAGAALLWETQHIGKASMPIHLVGDAGVSGSPTIAAATVNAIFARLGSPMVGTGKLVEQVSRQTNIDDAFALAVWWTETNDGAAGVGLADRNPGSVRGSVGYPSAFDGYTIYPSYSAAIVYWFNMLRNNYVNRGLETFYAIARPYVGTTSYPLWAGKVIALMYKYRGIAPPPPPPPVLPASLPEPKPTINPLIITANKARIHKLTTWRQYLSANNFSTLTMYRGQVQENNIVTTTTSQPANSTPSLPFGANLAIVLFGLLTALAIALYARKLPVEQPQGDQPSAQKTITDQPLANNQYLTLVRMIPSSSPQTSTGESAPSTAGTPITNVPIAPRNISLAPAFSLPTRNQNTDAFPRRIILLPTRTDENISTGSLLDRYGQKDGTYN